METSATSGSNVELTFDTLINEIEKFKPQQDAIKKSRSCLVM